LKLENTAVQLITMAFPDLSDPNPSSWLNWNAVFGFVRKLATILEIRKSTVLSEASRTFIRASLSACMFSLSTSRPVEPKTWTRARNNCTCGPCGRLNTFLVDPAQPELRLQYASRTIQHLESRVPNGRTDYNIRIEMPRHSRPTIIVRKTLNEFQRQTREWNTNMTTMQQQLRNLQTPFVKKVLGEEIPLDRHLQADGGRVLPQPSLMPMMPSAQNSRSAAPAAGVKRKVDVVDLTGDLSDSESRVSRPRLN
jgi:hypothetical protein